MLSLNSNSNDGYEDTLQSDTDDLDSGCDQFGESSISEKTKDRMIIITVVLLIASILVWIFKRKETWDLTIKLSIALSSHQEKLTIAIFWIFSEFLYRWYFLVIAGLLVFSPRKDRAWTSVTFFMGSYWVRQYIRLLIHEGRPQFDTTDIKKRDCACSFGMPSGHSEGICLLYGLMFYNMMPSRPSGLQRAVYTTVGSVICTGVFISRLYDGTHSIMQVILGGLQGTLAFLLFMKYEKKTNAMFREFLNENGETIRKIWLLVGIGCLINLLLWLMYFDPMLRELKITPVTCIKCFRYQNIRIRKDLGQGLMFPFFLFGLIIGAALLKTKYEVKKERIEQYKIEIVSIKGIMRLVLDRKSVV